ncbi:14399_t:CDS:2, partial [Dentiscutata erythropus]
NLGLDTIDDNFIEDVVDEPQATLKAILGDNGISNIIEMWRIRRIGGLSRKENLVVLFNDGSHIYTYQVLENSPSLTAIESSVDTTIQVNLNLQSFKVLTIVQVFKKLLLKEIDLESLFQWLKPQLTSLWKLK